MNIIIEEYNHKSESYIEKYNGDASIYFGCESFREDAVLTSILIDKGILDFEDVSKILDGYKVRLIE